MPHLPCPATPEFVGVAGFFCCRMTLPLWYPVGGLSPALPSRQALAVPCGRLARFAARLPCLWFAVLPPSPLPPFPAGRGRFFCFLMQGASPLASPAFNRLRHLQSLPLWYPEGGLPPAALAVPAAVVSGGGLPPALPSRRALTVPCGWLARFAAHLPCLWFVVLPPIPPTPFPGGEGGDFLVYFAGGFAPGTPALNRLRHLQSLPLWYPVGGLAPGVAVSASVNGTLWGACPLCRPPTLPLV